jgi:periplasmic protein TonB
VTHDPEIFSIQIKADPSERLVTPSERSALARRSGFAFLLAICLLIHASVLFFLLDREKSIVEPTREEEIPIEVVMLPPEQKAEPAPKKPRPPDLVTPPVVKEKPPPEKVELDEADIARDAPRTGNDSKTHKGEPEKETKAPRIAPPPKLVTPQPPQDKPEQEKASPPVQEKVDKPSPPTEPQKLADEKLDAEALDKAQPEAPAKPQEKQAPQPSKTPATQGKKTTVAQQLAAFSAAPTYSFGAATKALPMGGGTEKASYLSILYGMIMRQMHFPPVVRERHVMGEGIVSFYVDDSGHLTHQAVYRSSGLPDLDAAALNAVRRAAPFPAPPRNDPHAIWFHFDTR